MAKYNSDNIGKYALDKIEQLTEGGKNLETQMAYSLAEALDTKTDESISAESKGNKTTIYIDKGESEGTPPGDVIDLKKFFAKSDKRTETEDGGWYLVVPMRRYTRKSERSFGMSRRLYEDLRIQGRGGRSELDSSFLYDNRRQESMIRDLNYTPKAKSITRIPREAGGHQYVTFRTVSDKSHPASWILNRHKADQYDRTKEVQRIIRDVAQYNIKQLKK